MLRVAHVPYGIADVDVQQKRWYAKTQPIAKARKTEVPTYSRRANRPVENASFPKVVSSPTV